jgi:hypothetical protein
MGLGVFPVFFGGESRLMDSRRSVATMTSASSSSSSESSTMCMMGIGEGMGWMDGLEGRGICEISGGTRRGVDLALLLAVLLAESRFLALEERRSPDMTASYPWAPNVAKCEVIRRLWVFGVKSGLRGD